MEIARTVKRPFRPLRRWWVGFRLRRSYGPFRRYVAASEEITGWARGPEAIELARVSSSLAADAVIVEIGSFLGTSAVLLAGGRTVAGSGVVHCVDPFDGSGDAYSAPVYREITDELSESIRHRFDRNVFNAGVAERVVVHEGTAEQVGALWTSPIDMLFLDGDQSPVGARSAYDVWSPFLKPDGIIAIHTSADRQYSPDHDGQRRVVLESLIEPDYVDRRCVGTTTFARRAS